MSVPTHLDEKQSSQVKATTPESDKKERQMKIPVGIAAVVTSVLVIGTAVPGWAAMPINDMPVANHAVVIALANGPLSVPVSSLEPSPALQAARQSPDNCKAGHVYSQHDIVGDPQACIMGTLTIGVGAP